MNYLFKRLPIFGSACLLPCLAFGAGDTSREISASELPKPLVQNEMGSDPTAPSSRMLERISTTTRNTTPPAAPLENRSREVIPPVATHIPDIRIKAIVLSDDDHGSAILTANGRSVSVKLSRAKHPTLANGASRSQSRFTLENVTFSVEDFSENSVQLRLSSDNSVMVVQ